MDASLIIATSSFFVAAGSATFSVVVWWRSGSLVRIDAKDGYVMTRGGIPDLEQALPIDDPIFVADQAHPLTRIFRIVNTGRQPVAVIDWWVDCGGEEFQGFVIPDDEVQATERPTVTLEPGHLIELAIPFGTLRKWHDSRVERHPSMVREPRLVVELGTGKKQESERRPIPPPHSGQANW